MKAKSIGGDSGEEGRRLSRSSEKGSDALHIEPASAGHSPTVQEHSEVPPSAQPNAERVESEPSESNYLTGIRLYALAASLVFCVFLSMLNVGMVATAVPSITNDFGSIADVGWYGTANLITSCTFQPLAGRIYTHQSLKWTLICFIGVFELGNLICGLAVSSDMLIVGRAIAGIGTGGMSNGALSMIAHASPLHKRPVLVSYVSNFARIGSICGPIIGGALAQKVSWRWAFLINCPAGAVASVIIFLVRMPQREDQESLKRGWRELLAALDLRGFALFAPGCVMLLLALEWGGIAYSWNSATIIGLFCGAAATIALFVAWEVHMGERALIPLSILRVRTVWSGGILIFLQFGCLFLLAYYLPIWFQAVKGANPVDSGLMTLPSVLSQIFVGLAAAYGVQKFGYFTPFAIAGSIATAIGAGLMTTFEPWTGPNLWIGYQILMGSGRGLAGQIALTAIQFAVPKSQVSLGTSVLTFSGSLGSAVFIAAGQTLFVNVLSPALNQYAPGVDPATVVNTGSTEIQQLASPDQRFELVLAYNYALTRMFFLGCAASAVSLFFCFGLGWGNIRKKREQEKKAKETEKQTA